jgi:hypothetical protein
MPIAARCFQDIEIDAEISLGYLRRGDRVGALSVISFIPIGVFDEATIRTIGKAFDAACKELHDGGQPAVVHEVMIKRIIAAARKGERNVTRLRDAANHRQRYC